MIDVNDTAMLLIDHQSGLFQVVQDMHDNLARERDHARQGRDTGQIRW